MPRPLLPADAALGPAADLPDRPAQPGVPDHQHAWRRFMFDQSRDAVYRLDDQGRVLEANASFAALLGCGAAAWRTPCSAGGGIGTSTSPRTGR